MTEYLIETVTVEGVGLTIPRLVWNRFGARGQGMVEKIYDLNPGISNQPTHLPVGLVVRIPVPSDSDLTREATELVTLWS